MTEANRVDNDRARLAELGATILGPLLVRHVNRYVASELSPPPEELSDAALTRWRQTLLAAVGPALELMLSEDATGLWESRGLPLPSEARITRDTALAVRRTVMGTDNIAQTLADAAAGKEGSAALDVLLGLTHQELVGSSLTMTGTDQLYDRFSADAGLTGRRRWVVADPGSSRHEGLDGEIAAPGEPFSLDGRDVFGPREDPADVAMWSNCSCSLEYELEDGTWK